MSIVSRGCRCTTFRDGATDGQGPCATMKCDVCGATAEMRRKDERTLTSPAGWVDDGPLDRCVACAGSEPRSSVPGAGGRGE
jgi:hypothetical protein